MQTSFWSQRFKLYFPCRANFPKKPHSPSFSNFEKHTWFQNLTIWPGTQDSHKPLFCTMKQLLARGGAGSPFEWFQFGGKVGPFPLVAEEKLLWEKKRTRLIWIGFCVMFKIWNSSTHWLITVNAEAERYLIWPVVALSSVCLLICVECHASKSLPTYGYEWWNTRLTIMSLMVQSVHH